MSFRERSSPTALARSAQALRIERPDDLPIDVLPEPIWVVDKETLRFLAVNEAAVRKYGYSRDEFLHMTCGTSARPKSSPPSKPWSGPGALARGPRRNWDGASSSRPPWRAWG